MHISLTLALPLCLALLRVLCCYIARFPTTQGLAPARLPLFLHPRGPAVQAVHNGHPRSIRVLPLLVLRRPSQSLCGYGGQQRGLGLSSQRGIVVGDGVGSHGGWMATSGTGATIPRRRRRASSSGGGREGEIDSEAVLERQPKSIRSAVDLLRTYSLWHWGEMIRDAGTAGARRVCQRHDLALYCYIQYSAHNPVKIRVESTQFLLKLLVQDGIIARWAVSGLD